MSDRRGGRTSGEARLVRRPGVLHRRLEGESVLLDPDSGTYYALNEVGSRVWELCSAEPTFDQVVETLLAEYEVDPDRLREDLGSLLDRLVEERLLHVEGP